LGLPSHREERSAARACVQGRPDGCLGALVLVAEGLGRLQSGVGRMNLAASDASVAVRLDA